MPRLAPRVTPPERNRRVDRIEISHTPKRPPPASSTAAADLTVSTVILEGQPADVLVAEARRWNADLLVVGSHGAVKRLALGSVSTRVAAHAHCSVEIVRCPHADERA
jgi:nucleotide-binding universal stress UspA family protein